MVFFAKSSSAAPAPGEACLVFPVSCNTGTAPAPLREGKQRIAIYCDRTGLEVFASDGLTYVPMPSIAKSDDLSLAVSVRGGDVRVSSLAVYELRSAWKTR